MFTYVTGVNSNLSRIVFRDYTGKIQQSLILYIYLQALRNSLQNKPHSWLVSDPWRVHHVQVPEEEQTDDPNKRFL